MSGRDDECRRIVQLCFCKFLQNPQNQSMNRGVVPNLQKIRDTIEVFVRIGGFSHQVSWLFTPLFPKSGLPEFILHQ